MALDTAEFAALVDNLEASLKSAHAAQVAALEALRKLQGLCSHGRHPLAKRSAHRSLQPSLSSRMQPLLPRRRDDQRGPG